MSRDEAQVDCQATERPELFQTTQANTFQVVIHPREYRGLIEHHRWQPSGLLECVAPVVSPTEI
jgi:hypothetical protein